MESVLDKLKIIETLVKIPLYGVVGYTQGKLVYSSNVEGIRDLWALDLSTSESIRLTKEGVYGVASIRPTSPLVVYTRDVSKGREQHQVFYTDIQGREEFKFEEMMPRRIWGIDFDGELIGVSAASEKAIELWVLKPDGEVEKVYETNSILFLTDVGYGKIVGQGIIKGDLRAFELFVYDLRSLEFRVYTPKEGSVNKSPRIWKEKMLFATTAFGDEKLMIYDLTKDELEEPEFTYDDYKKYKFTEYVAYDWTRDGKIWFIGKRDGRTKAFIDGKEIPLPEGVSTTLTIVSDKVYATYTSLSRPHSIYEIDMKTGKQRLVLGAQLPSEVVNRVGKVYLIRYKSFDGLEIPTFVVESKVISRPGPTVVYVHGGPWAEVMDSWSVFIMSLVVSGYHVVAPNFRGSTGYGEEFRRMDIGDPGGDDLLDVVYAAKWAEESGLASKLAITGYSYGGYMTFLATVKYPDIWSAGVAGAGIVDWEEMYGLSDAFFKRFIEVLFAGRRELWKERSPITYAENLKTPLCIVHPQNDSRTPLKPILHFVEKLLELGKTFELHVTPDMGHAIIRVDDVFKIVFPMVLFFDRHMKATNR